MHLEKMNEKKKIALLNFWPEGGMRHYSDDLANILKQRYHVIYVTNYPSTLGQTNKQYHISEKRIDLPELTRMAMDIIKLKPAIIHINCGHPAIFPLFPLFRMHHSIITVHDARSHKGESLLSRTYQEVNNMFISLFIEKIFVHSEVIKQDLPQGLRRKKVLISPFMNFSALNKGKKEKRKSKKTNLLFFGRILEYKGLPYLVEAFKELPQDKYTLTIAGEGELTCKLPQTENISVINRFISDKEMTNLFNETDILVLPYLSASQSGVVHAAFAFGKPVVATKVGAIPDAVHDQVNGLLIEPKSSNAIIKALHYLDDKKVYERMVSHIKKEQGEKEKEVLMKISEAYNYDKE